MSKTQEKKRKEKTKSNKTLAIIIITIISILILVLGGIVIWFIYSSNLENKTTNSDWLDKYYDFLKNDFKSQGGVINETSKMGFIELKEYDNPVMYIITGNTGEKKNYNNVDMFFIGDDQKVYRFVFSTIYDTSIELIYHVPEKKYRYFIKNNAENTTDYILIEPEIKYFYNNSNNNDSAKDIYEKERKYYYIRDDKTAYEKNLDLKEKELGYESNLIIDPGVEEQTVPCDYDETKLKEALDNSIKKYKKISEIIDKKIKEKVEKEVNEKPKEQTKPTTSEPVKENGLKVGTYTIEYGTYKACVEDYCESFELRSDGTAIYNGTQYYYSVKDMDFAQSAGEGNKYVHPAIVLSNSPGGDSALGFTPYGAVNGCILTDGDLTCIK